MSIVVKFACYLLKKPLSLQERTRLVGAILESNDALPLQESIKVLPRGIIMVNGQPLPYDKTIQVRESARAMLVNQAHELVRNQIAHIAGTRGVVEGDTPEKLYFYRAAIWVLLTYEALYREIAGSEE